ncbi:hypothetical protein GCM10027074_56190 [Streptomyces deserti]
MNATRTDTDAPPTSTSAMRAAATWFFDQPTLPRHQSTKLFSQDFHDFLDQLIPRIEKLTAAGPEDDVPAQVALAGVAEARRRMDEPEAAGLRGEVERVKRLARSVVALCDHYDALTGITMCVVCDRVIEGDEWEPSDQIGPYGGVVRSGRVHFACATRHR